jgi:hypothetical protein
VTNQSADQSQSSAQVHDGDEATVVDALKEPPEEVASIAPDVLQSPHQRRIVVVPLVVGLLFCFGPLLAVLAGDQAEPIDNRALASMPSASEGWDFIPNFTTWANDHLGLRSQAVRTGTELSEAMFDEPPQYGLAGGAAGVGANRGPAPGQGMQYPDVIQGTDGWLYLGADVSAPCTPQLTLPVIVDSLERLDAAVTASGRTLVIAVVPDKSTIVPQHLPDRYAGKQCASERKAEFWDQVAAADLPLIDLRGPLGETQARASEPLYRPTDSHWNGLGASVFVTQVVTRLDPALLDGGAAQFVQGPAVAVPGDLGAMLGKETTDRLAEVTVERPGVSLAIDQRAIDVDEIPELGPGPVVIDGSSTQAPLFPGRTAIIGDSFYGTASPLFAPFFDHLTMLHNQSDAEPLAQVMVDADTIVVELVERSTSGGYVQLVTPAVVDVIERVLANHPRVP